MADASYNGGPGVKNFADNSQVSGGTAGVGRTFLNAEAGTRLLQNGTITSVSYYAHASIANGMKFKVFRPNGSNWDFVAESEKFTPVAGSAQTQILSTPIAGVQPGDVLGYWIDFVSTPGMGAVVASGAAGNTIVWIAGDNTGTNATFPNGIAAFNLNLEAFGLAPVAAMSGDSIECGHGTSYNSFLDGTGPLGDITSELGFCMRTSVGSSFTYQDYAAGSKDWSWTRLTSMPAIQSGTGVHASSGLGNTEFWFHCGVNDVFAGRSWASVQADLDAIYALCGSTPMFVDEIAPWGTASTGSDARAATTRTFNANYATWAVGKATVRIVPVWAALGVFWASTGLNDKLNPIYDSGDGIHPNAAGAAVIATARANVRGAYFGYSITPAPGALSLVGAAPGLKLDTRLTPNPASLGLTGGVLGMTASSSRTITPGAGALAATGAIPVVINSGVNFVLPIVTSSGGEGPITVKGGMD